MKTKTGTITATGTAGGVNATQGTNGPDIAANVGVGGTFTSAVVQVDAKLVGGTLYYPAAMIDRKTGVKSNGTATPADSTNTSWLVDTRGCSDLRVSVLSGTPTSMSVEIVSGQKSDFDGPLQFNTLNYTSASSFGAGISFTGATTANTILMPDNLADALSIAEGANSYLTFVTTDAGEKILVKKDMTMNGGTDIIFSGTTGQSKILMTVNLADALTMGEGANAYLTFVTTTGGEKVSVIKNLVGTLGITSIGPTSGIGYATGAGGTVTQITSRTTGVTLNTVSGNIVLVSAAGSATPFSVTLTNSAIAAGDTVILSQKSGTDKYTTQVVTAVAAGSCQITLANAAGATVEQPVFNFNVIKGVAA